ncbi:MAG: hypothetical protein ACM3OC_05635 [Deltaproteobacteria bacterium]
MLGNERGMNLVIVIFIIMFIGGLAWTLTTIGTSDTAMSVRMFDSERAMYAAQAGIEWGINQINTNASWRTSADGTCSGTDWLLHTLPGAQYRVCSRDAADGTETVYGNVAIEAEGYVPSYASYVSTRKLKVLYSAGSFSNVAQAKNIFDWSGMTRSQSNYIDGDMQALYYNGDGNMTYNEIGRDIDANMPPARGNHRYQRRIASDPFPAIDMSYYENASGSEPWQSLLTAKISSLGTGQVTEITVSPALFSGPASNWTGQIVRNISRGHCTSDTYRLITDVISPSTVRLSAPSTDWQQGERITLAVKPVPGGVTYESTEAQGRHTKDISQYTLTFPVAMFTNSDGDGEHALRMLAYRDVSGNIVIGGWGIGPGAEPYDWGIIYSVDTGSAGKKASVRMDDDFLPGGPADPVLPEKKWNNGSDRWYTVVRRFRGTYSNKWGKPQLEYTMNDAIFDARGRQSWEAATVNPSVKFQQVGCVLEGDAAMKGGNVLSFSRKPLVYPNLATKYGSIICLDPPDTGNVKDHNFDDFAYSENGDVSFNYLSSFGLYGSNVYLRGPIQIDYNPDAASKISGYAFSMGGFKWKEQ